MTSVYVVICPKSIAVVKTNYFGMFLFDFLKHFKIQATVANDVWGAYKYKIKQKFNERFDTDAADIAFEEAIARERSWLTPETPILNKFGQDIIPLTDQSIELLREKVRELIDRQWPIITYFISEEPERYPKLNVNALTLEGFFDKCMENHRDFVEAFSKQYPQKRDDDTI